MDTQQLEIKIAAGIVLYNAEIKRLKQNINAVINQVDYLCLVDNGSDNIDEVLATVREFSNIEVVKLNENKGIAFALNRIVDKAEENGCQWVLTLDQDSVCPSNLIEEYRKYFDYDTKIAMFTPKITDNNEASGTNIDFHNNCEYVTRCISSASLLNVAVCRKVGNFDEIMFIDYVDFDLCQNLLNHGYKILRVNTVALTHEVGKAKEIKLFSILGKVLHIKKFKKPLYTYCHSPIRTYYYARNTFYFIAKYKDSIDVKIEKRIFFKWLVLKIVFEDNKIEKIKAIRKGIKDSKELIKEIK